MLNPSRLSLTRFRSDVMEDHAKFHIPNELLPTDTTPDWGGTPNPSGLAVAGSPHGPQPVPEAEEEHHPACGCGRCLHDASVDAAADAAAPCSLDPLESTVNSQQETSFPGPATITQEQADYNAWLASRRTRAETGPEEPAPTERDPETIDDITLSANFRHSGWMDHRKKVLQALKRTDQTLHRVKAFASCGSFASIERSTATEPVTGLGEQHRYKFHCNCCHDRLCTPCANSRAAVLRRALFDQVGDQRATFITLTLSGEKETLKEKVDRLYKHFRALRIHPIWADNVDGGAAFLEIKYSDKARRWHPHLHIICHAKYFDQGRLSNAWRSITTDSFIVDMRAVRDKEEQLGYVTKYASKPLNMSFCNDKKLLDEAVVALKGRRLCLTFGTWYGTPLTDAEDATLEEDAVDAAGYEHAWTLEELFRFAYLGDVEAMYAVKSLNMFDRYERLMKPANPPPLEPYAGE